MGRESEVAPGTGRLLDWTRAGWPRAVVAAPGWTRDAGEGQARPRRSPGQRTRMPRRAAGPGRPLGGRGTFGRFPQTCSPQGTINTPAVLSVLQCGSWRVPSSRRVPSSLSQKTRLCSAGQPPAHGDAQPWPAGASACRSIYELVLVWDRAALGTQHCSLWASRGSLKWHHYNEVDGWLFLCWPPPAGAPSRTQLPHPGPPPHVGTLAAK